MKLTPLEIKQQTFEKSLRGFDVAEVKAYLSLMSNEWEHLLKKNRELEEKIDSLSERVKHYERVEEALHETLQTAKESAEQKLEGARAEARNSIEKAELQADAIIRDAHQKRQNIRQSILRLIDKKEEMTRSMESYLQMMQDSLGQFAKDEKETFTLPKEEELDSIPAPAKIIELDMESAKEEETVDLDMGSDIELEMDSETGSDEHGLDKLDDILDEID